MPISDLTNTKWLINTPTCSPRQGEYNLTGSIFVNGTEHILRSTDWEDIYLGYYFDDEMWEGETNQVLVTTTSNDENWLIEINSTSLLSNTYVLNITGGRDAQDSDLIAWLQANATQLTISNLTGTTWLLNNSLGEKMPNGRYFNHQNDESDNYSINFTSNGVNYTEISFYDKDAKDWSPDNCNMAYGNTGVWKYANNYWVNSSYKTIVITGGADVANSKLIAWLETNATQAQPKILKINNKTLLKINNKNINSLNGVSLMSGVEATPSGYQVTLNFSESHLYYKTSVTVYDGQDTTGELLFSDTNEGVATPTTTVTCTSGYLCVDIITSGFGDASTTVTSGTITEISTWPFILSVGSDGAVIFIINYDD